MATATSRVTSRAARETDAAQVDPVTKDSGREVLGAIDIGVGLPTNAWDAVPDGVPDAQTSMMGATWERQTALDKATPKARPGYVQRWVRIATADGAPDISNKAEALMKGWRPRRENTLAANEVGMPVYDAGDGRGGVIVFKGQLLLCEIKQEFAQALMDQMAAEEQATHQTIYRDARKGNGMPAKYATLDYDSGRDSADLIE